MVQPSTQPIHVTDHAVLRYMERCYGFNMELVRAHIADVCAGPAAFGASAVRAEGVKFEIDNNRVITVVPDSTLPSRTREEKSRNRWNAKRVSSVSKSGK